MDKRTWLGRHFFSLIGQLVIALLCLVFIAFVYFKDIVPEKEVRSFIQTTCHLKEKKLNEHKTAFFPRYRTEFLVSHTVNNHPYQEWVSGNGLDSSFSYDQDSQQYILDQFRPGQTYVCWYDPAFPSRIVLVKRYDWTAVFPLFIPLIIFLVILYFLARTLGSRWHHKK